MEREEQRISFEELKFSHLLTIRGEHRSLEEVKLDMQKVEGHLPYMEKYIRLQKEVIQ